MESSAGAGKVFNVACGERVTLNAVLDTLAEITGTELQADHQPGRPGEVRHSLADIGHARETFGYEPAVPFDEGIRRTLEFTVQERERAAAASA
jgi:UDP-glucose 4-epimerase